MLIKRIKTKSQEDTRERKCSEEDSGLRTRKTLEGKMLERRIMTKSLEDAKEQKCLEEEPKLRA